MDILVIGVSSVFSRRVFPALITLDCIDKIHLASKRTSVSINVPEKYRGNFYHNYQTALSECHPCIAYISLPNHMHAEWARKALLAGFHVIVDKPAFLNWQETQSLLQLAKKQNRCLAESTVWSFHPQIKAAQEAFERICSEPRSIQAVFSFPPLSPDNFRNNPKMGGGSFLDLGRYAVTPGRIFFKDAPIALSAKILGIDHKTYIDTAFVLSATYSRGRVFQGFFSFDTEYKNSISILGKGLSITLEPVFTTPTHPPICEINFKSNSITNTFQFEPADSFAEFFRTVIYSILEDKWMCWLDILESDAHTMHLALKNIEENADEY